jgi:cytoskeletal protein RodZ
MAKLTKEEEQKKAERSSEIIGFITIGLVISLLVVFVPKLFHGSTGHADDKKEKTAKQSSSSSYSSSASSSSTSSSSSAKSSSSSSSEKKPEKSNSNSSKPAKKDSKTYDDTNAIANAQKFTDDDYRNSANIGQSVHLTSATIARVDTTDGGLWIQTTSDDNATNLAHVQAINLASYNFQEGDKVDVKATLQGMRKSMITFKGDTDKYPTIWIKSIETVK